MQSVEPSVPDSAGEPRVLLPPQAPQGRRSLGQTLTAAFATVGTDFFYPAGDPGAIEYASWLRLLRRPTP